jgi:hypothetical protein
VFDQNYVKRLHGTNVKQGKNKRDLAESIREDIRNFKKSSGADRVVMIWAASTEIFMAETEVHQTIDAFETAMENDDEAIAPSMLYAYASIMEGVPFATGTPSMRYTGAGEAGPGAGRADRRQGLQDGPDADQDGAGADVQGPHAGRERLVQYQYPRQPRRRGAG